MTTKLIAMMALLGVIIALIVWLKRLEAKRDKEQREHGKAVNELQHRDATDEIKKRVDAVKPVGERDAIDRLRSGKG